jgi:large subunit ribosomal protein L27
MKGVIKMELRFKLDIQLFASHKGVGSTKNGRDSAGRRLGSKRTDGQYCKAGAIIYRQRGTRIYPGVNTMRGGDDTIFATKAGIVRFERVGKNRKIVSVYEIEA